jgi:hypothetical protein
VYGLCQWQSDRIRAHRPNGVELRSAFKPRALGEGCATLMRIWPDKGRPELDRHGLQ